jgi:hypothetical protein
MPASAPSDARDPVGVEGCSRGSCTRCLRADISTTALITVGGAAQPGRLCYRYQGSVSSRKEFPYDWKQMKWPFAASVWQSYITGAERSSKKTLSSGSKDKRTLRPAILF